MKTRIFRIFQGIVPIAAFFIVWQITAGRVPKGILPPPTKVFAAMLQSMTVPNAITGTIWKHILVSLEHIGLGLVFSIIIGNILGFLLGTYFKKAEIVFLPFFKICEKLNPFAIIPIFMIFFGIGTLEKVSIVFWASVWPIITTTRETARSLDNNLIKAVRAMGANRWELFSKVIFPFTLPNLFTGLKLAISTAFFMIVAAELVGSKDGLGWYYMSQQHTYKLDLVYGSVLFITALAILFRWLFGRLEKKFIVWKEAAFR